MPDIFLNNDEAPEEVKADSIAEKSETKEKQTAVQNEPKTAIEKEREGIVIKPPKTVEERKKLPGFTNNPLSAFCYFPTQVDFINKDPEENVVLLLRRHPITNLKWVLGVFVLVIVPGFLSVMSFYANLPGDYQLLFSGIWYLFTFTFAFEQFLSWFFAVNLVTDERVFDIDFTSLVYRKMTDANIDQIQDVTVQIGGGVRTLFNYGDVIIQTAAEIPQIKFESVPQPDRVARILRELRVEEEAEKLEGRVR